MKITNYNIGKVKMTAQNKTYKLEMTITEPRVMHFFKHTIIHTSPIETGAIMQFP